MNTSILGRLVSASTGGEPTVLATVIEPGNSKLLVGSKMLIEVEGNTVGTLGNQTVDNLVSAKANEILKNHSAKTFYFNGNQLDERLSKEAATIYIEAIESKPVFIIVGAGHIGQCLTKLAAMLRFHVVVIDDRADFANHENLPAADEIICEDFEKALNSYSLGSNTSVVMVTRGHKQDELSLRCCLERGAGYIGMIGSKRRTTAVLEHLHTEGFSLDELAKVRTPIGIDLGGETPEEIALSIMAEVIMLRNNGTGTMKYHRTKSTLATS
tara:strand:+ start:12886 stop:13695 length:810 start_codon:yes stop_codon:yes gene_type:complete